MKSVRLNVNLIYIYTQWRGWCEIQKKSRPRHGPSGNPQLFTYREPYMNNVITYLVPTKTSRKITQNDHLRKMNIIKNLPSVLEKK